MTTKPTTTLPIAGATTRVLRTLAKHCGWDETFDDDFRQDFANGDTRDNSATNKKAVAEFAKDGLTHYQSRGGGRFVTTVNSSKPRVTPAPKPHSAVRGSSSASIDLVRDKTCKHSLRFASDSEALSTIYINKPFFRNPDCKRVRVTIEEL